MNKKDYDKIAELLHDTKKIIAESYSGYKLITAVGVIDWIQAGLEAIFSENNNFDIEKFSNNTELE